uniref:Putative basigin n=1 Tax=Corethrella appendiculata TaxID=1370023 RepID=U5EQY7_9DIPT
MEYKLIPILRYSSFVLLFLAITAQADAADLVPNYDYPDQQIKLFDVRNPLVLSCNVKRDGDYELSWTKDGVDVSKVESLKSRYNIIKEEHKFIIDRALESDAGLYTCSVKSLGESSEIRVIANVAVKLPSNSPVVEGEKLTITCIVVGTDPELSWRVGNETYSESEGRIILQEDATSKIKNSVLIIESATLDDRNEYVCEARNKASDLRNISVQSATYVRVKGKLAALWPFIGICAEVFVLCAIILIYEKRRNKTDLEESDTDQSPDQEKLKK